MKFTTKKSSVKEATEMINKLWGENSEDPYRPVYHPIAPHGWMNDPNGLIYKNGYYHVFYQWNPYASVWGNMHWGHMRSRNLHDWEHLPVALATEEIYEKDGCFSGSAIEVKGQMHLFYTSNIFLEGGHPYNEGPLAIQMQAGAVSDDDIVFNKYPDNPIIKKPPQGGTLVDFRDPKLIERDTHFQMIVVSRQDNYGELVSYITRDKDDLSQWHYDGQIAKADENLGYMWECPDLLSINGKEVIILSAMGAKLYNYKNIVGYIVADEGGSFNPEYFKRMDGMENFYAPQTFAGLDDYLLLSWITMPQIDTDSHNWNGCLSLPQLIGIGEDKRLTRKVTLIDSATSKPIARKSNFELKEKDNLKIKGDTLHISGLIEPQKKGRLKYKLKASETGDLFTELIIDFEMRKIVLDSRQSGQIILNERVDLVGSLDFSDISIYEAIDIEIFIDKSVIEIFILDGKCAMTTAVFSSPEHDYTFIECEDVNVTFKVLETYQVKASENRKILEES